jgi:recombination protein RecA
MAKKKDDREARIAAICAEINKSDYGGEDHNAVTYLGSRDVLSMERWTSGHAGLDDALGGGWPKGRFIEIFGPESGGKTTLCLHAIAEHQRAYPDEDIGLIDSEYAFDEVYAKAIGVDQKYLLVNQPDSGVQALNILKMMLERGVTLIIVDSVAALTPREEMEADLGEQFMGTQARMMSQSLRQINSIAGKRRATIIWTNQIREKIGVMFGNPETTPGGRALRHYDSIRAHIRRVSTVKGPDGQAVSSKTKVEVKKNKTAPPFRSTEFHITYGIGIDLVAAVLDDGIAYGLVEKRGAWLSFQGEQLGQGHTNVVDRMRGDGKLVETIKNAVATVKKEGAAPKPEEKPDIKRPKRDAVRTPVTEEDSDPDAIDSPESEVEVTDV